MSNYSGKIYHWRVHLSATFKKIYSKKWLIIEWGMLFITKLRPTHLFLVTYLEHFVYINCQSFYSEQNTFQVSWVIRPNPEDRIKKMWSKKHVDWVKNHLITQYIIFVNDSPIINLLLQKIIGPVVFTYSIIQLIDWLIESFIVGTLKLIVYQVYCQHFFHWG